MATASSTTSTKTVFTADVVEYNFLPEKYASAVSRVVAELRVHIETDWQTSVDTWYSGLDLVDDTDAGTSASTQLTNATYRERMGQVLTSAQQELIVRDASKAISGLSLPTLFNADDAQPLVDEVTGNPLSAENQGATRTKMAKQIAQGILYQIAKDAEYYTGTGVTHGIAVGSADGAGEGTPISTQFKNVLQAILSNSATSTQNNLIIDEDKVKADLGGKAATLDDYHALTAGTQSLAIKDDIPVDQATASKLQHLLSASAFAPVINRWVSGGNFSRNVVDGTIQAGALTSIAFATGSIDQDGTTYNGFATVNKGTKGALENGAYSGVAGTDTSGSGSNATFNLTVGTDSNGKRTLAVTVPTAGTNYAVNDTITIANTAWGGSSTDDVKYDGPQLVLTVTGVDSDTGVTSVGTNFDTDLKPAIAELAPTEMALNSVGANTTGAKATVAITSDPATGARVMTASLTASGAGYDSDTDVAVYVTLNTTTTGTTENVAFTFNVDSGNTGFHFDLNNDTAGSSDNIQKHSELVFPVKIVVADAGMVPEGGDMGQAVTLSGSNESDDAAINAMEFQLNIIMSTTATN